MEISSTRPFNPVSVTIIKGVFNLFLLIYFINHCKSFNLCGELYIHKYIYAQVNYRGIDQALIKAKFTSLNPTNSVYFFWVNRSFIEQVLSSLVDTAVETNGKDDNNDQENGSEMVEEVCENGEIKGDDEEEQEMMRKRELLMKGMLKGGKKKPVKKEKVPA